MNKSNPGLKSRRSRLSMCEQRSYLPGDAEVGLAPAGCSEERPDPSPSTCECRRSWASSQIPDDRDSANATPASALPGDSERIDSLSLKMDAVTARLTREAYNDSETEYRWDPEHHNRPPAGAWRRTDSGWSRIPASQLGKKSPSTVDKKAMDVRGIVSRMVSAMVPDGVIERPVGGLSMSSGEIGKAWLSASAKLGLGSVPWIPAGRLVGAYSRGEGKLVGAERLVAELVADMAGEAIMGGYSRVSVPVGRFAFVKSACSFCPSKKKLVGLSVSVVA